MAFRITDLGSSKYRPAFSLIPATSLSPTITAPSADVPKAWLSPPVVPEKESRLFTPLLSQRKAFTGVVAPLLNPTTIRPSSETPCASVVSNVPIGIGKPPSIEPLVHDAAVAALVHRNACWPLLVVLL